jgi:hypothetical protein
MFDKRIFNLDRLGSEKEKNSLEYDGWAILAQINAQNSEQAIQWAKHNLCVEGTEFNVQDNRYFLGTDSDDKAIEVFPIKVPYKENQNTRLVTYNLIIESEFFGFKHYGENKHRDLCGAILRKIRKRKGFWVREGKRFPIE